MELKDAEQPIRFHLMSILDSLYSSLVNDLGYVITLLIALVVVLIEGRLRARSAFNDVFDAKQ